MIMRSTALWILLAAPAAAPAQESVPRLATEATRSDPKAMTALQQPGTILRWKFPRNMRRCSDLRMDSLIPARCWSLPTAGEGCVAGMLSGNGPTCGMF